MLNKVQIIGRLGLDPELKHTQGGNAFCSLSVATDESYTNNQGEKVQNTEWHRVQVWSRQAENCAKYLTKGSLVYVEGNLTTRKWQAQDGSNRYTTEIRAQRIQFLDRKSDNFSHAQNEQYEQPVQNTNNEFPQNVSDMDDVPF